LTRKGQQGHNTTGRGYSNTHPNNLLYYFILCLELFHIEDAVRANFIFEGREQRPWERDEDYRERMATQHSLYTSRVLEGSRLMGLAVFIGVARMYGFPLSEISDYLGLEPSLFKDCVALYDRFLGEAIEIKLGGGEVPITSKAQKALVKTGLVRAFLIRRVLP
jgi:hypothetical protein